MRYVLIALAIAGMYVSTRALMIHNSTDVPPCSINEHWDCGVVNHSEYAVMFGVPVAEFGIAGYFFLAVAAIAGRRGTFTGAALLGLAFALRLTWIEKTILQTWCLYCVISQCIILAMMVLGFAWIAMRKHEEPA